MKRRLTHRQIQELAYDRSHPRGPSGHDALVGALSSLRDGLEPKTLAREFLWSYCDGPIEYASMLPTFSIFRHFSRHAFRKHATALHCTYCGDYLSVQVEPKDYAEVNASRFDGTSVFPTLVEAYASFELYGRGPTDEPVSVRDGAQALMEVLVGIDGLSKSGPDLSYSQFLSKSSKGLVPGRSKDDRHSGLLPLGALGILQPPGHPSHRTQYITSDEMNQRRSFKSEVPYPMQHWRTSHGVCWAAVNEWFGHWIAVPTGAAAT